MVWGGWGSVQKLSGKFNFAQHTNKKNADNPKYFVQCIHKTSQITLHFKTTHVYFEK
jgi:hypothetical protein